MAPGARHPEPWSPWEGLRLAASLSWLEVVRVGSDRGGGAGLGDNRQLLVFVVVPPRALLQAVCRRDQAPGGGDFLGRLRQRLVRVGCGACPKYSLAGGLRLG